MSDDFGSEYMQLVADTHQSSVVDQFMHDQRMGRDQTQLAKPPPAPKPAAMQPQEEEKSSVGGTALKVAKDVGVGIVEAPKQAIGGISDAVHNLFMLGDHVGNWLNENVVNLEVPIGNTGWGALDYLIQEPAKALAGPKGEVSEPRTVTGGLIRETSRFLVGLKGAGKVLPGTQGLMMVPAGGISDFVTRDPDGARLADLWARAGLPENVLTDYMQSDPTDSEMEKRFKNSLEGAGFGLLTEGLYRAARYVRGKYLAARQVQGKPMGEIEELKMPRIQEGDLKALGNKTDPLVAIDRKLAKAAKATETGVPGSVSAKGIVESAKTGAPAGKQTVSGLRINFARMDSPDSIKQVFKDTADAFSGSINEARRGAITLAETEKMAKRLGMTAGDLIQRTKGMAYNAEQIRAAGMVMDTTTEKLLEAATKAASPTASTVDQYIFRQMMTVHHAVQSEFMGAVAEAGRALNAVKIAQQGGTAEMAKSINALMTSLGGEQTSQALAQRLLILKETGGGVEQFIRKGAFATSMDAVKSLWVNALLSNPTTHIVNTTSNTFVTMQQIAERRAAEGISAALGREGGVASGESAAMLFGLKQGLWDSFVLAGKSLKTGESEMSPLLGKLDIPRQFNRGAARPVSSTAFNLNAAGPLGRTVDFIGAATEAPGRLLLSADEFFKSVGYRMELYAQAYREAVGKGLQGTALGQEVAKIVANAPETMRMRAADAALYNTFTNKTGWFGQAIMNLRSRGGAANPTTFIVPFVRTPVNIARYAFERTPFAPLVRQWREDIMAGGARADLALARMGTGSAIMLLASDLAMSGQITGRGPKAQGEREALRREGVQPYSVRIGDRWYSYNRMDPLGMTLGFAADFTEALNRGEIAPEDVDKWNEVMAGMIAAVAQTSVSKTYMRGISDLFAVMNDPQGYSTAYINRLAGTLVPAGVAAAERYIDPVTREAANPYDYITSRLPGLSDRLTPRRDLWGEEIRPQSGLGATYDTFSPIYASEVRDSPIDKEMTRLVADVRRIHKKTSFQGVNVDLGDWPQVYDAYVKLAGNDLKHPAWGKGAKDFLNDVVSGKSEMSDIYKLFTDGKDGGKVDFIRNIIRNYRDLAQTQIMHDPKFAEFQAFVHAKQEEKRVRNMPAVQ